MKFLAVFLLLFAGMHFNALRIAKLSNPEFEARIISRTSEALLVQTEIINPGNDTVKYLSMSCSWQDAYKIDSENHNWSMPPKICEYNTPVEIKIPPHKKVERIIEILLNKNVIKKDTLLRLGFS